jgi:hypothetical protein
MATSKEIEKDILKVSAETMQRVVLSTHAALVERTKVDTGWARSNWLVSVGKPIKGVKGSRKGVNKEAANASLGAIFKYKGSGKVFIVNNVPYIGYLNDGWVEAEVKGAAKELEK